MEDKDYEKIRSIIHEEMNASPSKSESALKEQYQQLYKERDVQMSKFWDNSKYIWGFLVVIFGAYGATLFKYFEGFKNCVCSSGKELLTNNLTILLCGLCIIGALVSYLWVLLARGTKAWYEAFEIAIWELDDCSIISDADFFKDEKNIMGQYKRSEKFYCIKTEKEANNTSNNNDNKSPNSLKKWFKCRNLVGLNSAPFSQSKVNILLGWLTSIIWMLLLFWQLYLYNKFSWWLSIELIPVVSSFLLAYLAKSSQLKYATNNNPNNKK